MNYNNKMRPVHPGEILQDELSEIGVKPRELSKDLRLSVSTVTRILQGKQGITAETALRLAQYFGTTPQLWFNLQKSWELRQKEIEIGDEIKESVTPRYTENSNPLNHLFT